MPLTDDGWVTISADDALKQAKSEIQKNLGIDTDVSDGSAMGRIAQMLANRMLNVITLLKTYMTIIFG